MYNILRAYRALPGLRKLAVMRQLAFAGFPMIFGDQTPRSRFYLSILIYSVLGFLLSFISVGQRRYRIACIIWCFESDLVFHGAKAYVVIVRTNEKFLSLSAVRKCRCIAPSQLPRMREREFVKSCELCRVYIVEISLDHGLCACEVQLPEYLGGVKVYNGACCNSL